MTAEKDNIKILLQPLYRGLPIIICIMVGALYFAQKYLQYATPLYESTAKIKLADINEGVPSAQMFKDFDFFANSNKIGAEVELLKSEVLLQKAVRALNQNNTVYRIGNISKTELYRQSPLVIEMEVKNLKWYNQIFGLEIAQDSLLKITTPNAQQIPGILGKPIQTDDFTLTVNRNDSLLYKRPNLPLNDRYELIPHSEDKLVRELRANLDVMAVDKDVPVLRISYRCPVAQKSADVVNAIAEAYIKDYLHEKYQTSDTTVDFLNRQLRHFSNNLAQSEQNIENYRNSENIINTRQETETDLRKIADLKKQLANIQMNLLAIDSLHNYLKSGNGRFLELAPNFEAFTDLLSTEIIKKIKQLQSEKRDLLLKYTPQNEKVTVVDGKIEDLTSYLQESINNTRINLQIKYNDLQNTIQQAETVFNGLPAKERNMQVLERNFQMNEQIYRFLHEKKTEAEIARAATISFHRIISRGEAPSMPVSPNSTLIKVFSVFLGLLAGIFLIYVLHIAKARVSTAVNIYKNSNTPVATEVPMLRKPAAQHRFFDKWALQMELKQWLQPGSVICISSFSNAEGKQFTANALAQALARQGKNVLLVYAGHSIQQPPAQGIETQYLGNGGPWRQLTAWKQTLQQWCSQYDVVIIKNAAIDHEPMSEMFMHTATLNLLLLDSRKTKLARIADADLMKNELQLPAMHFVLNRAGYTPSLFTEAKELLFALLHRTNKHRLPQTIQPAKTA